MVAESVSNEKDLPKDTIFEAIEIALLLNANEKGIFLKEENDLFINFDKIIVARLEPIFEVSNE
jgi:hypothetical protein